MNFQEKIDVLLKNGYAAMSAVLGHQLGLFHCLDSTPRTCDEVAKRAKCKSRYMKEWLSAMVCYGIVESEDGETFFMPDENVNLFNSNTTAMAILSFLPHLYGAFPAIKECFQESGPGGTSFTNYEKFYEHTPAVGTPLMVVEMAKHNQSITMLLEKGCKCLDIGCGWGTAIYTLAKFYPKTQFYGIDVIPDAIEQANQRCLENQISNAKYMVMNAMQLLEEWTDSFDYIITLHSMHDFGDPMGAAKEIFRVLKPGGFYSLVEINVRSDMLANKHDEPMLASILYTVSLFHCMPISLGPKGAGAGLGTMWGRDDAETLLKLTGFVDAEFHIIQSNNVNFHCVSRKPVC